MESRKKASKMNSNLLHPEDGSSGANQPLLGGKRPSIPLNDKNRGGQN